MGTHPIFESDFDCLTEMRVQFIFGSLLIASDAFRTWTNPMASTGSGPIADIFGSFSGKTKRFTDWETMIDRTKQMLKNKNLSASDRLRHQVFLESLEDGYQKMMNELSMI